MTSAEDLQRKRARQYALCTLALSHDWEGPGVEGIFDQALTNGLAAIVATFGEGLESRDDGQTLSAASLLKVIQDHGEDAGDGVVHVVHPPNPLVDMVTWLGDEAPRNFTRVRVRVLHAAIVATQRIRHARDTGQDPVPSLTQEAVQALAELDYHPALSTVTDEMRDQYELNVEAADRAAQGRAHAYLELVEEWDEEELERRAAIDYPAYSGGYKDEEMTTVEECPVCGNFALVAAFRDSWLDEVGIGQCVVCSYKRTAAVARAMATDLGIRRAAERDD
jgi:hypothetical protein